MDRPENQGLQQALEVVNTVKKELLRTNTVSFADVCAFAGGEVLESAGCGRVTVQVGRFDAQELNPSSSAVVPWNDVTPDSIKLAFSSSGLDSRETLLLLAALGEVDRIVRVTSSSSSSSPSEDDDDDDSLDEQPFVPVTFGSRDEIFGQKIGKSDFGVTFLSNLLSKSSRVADTDSIGRCILADAQLKALAQKYASNQAAFVKEVPEVYLKLTLLGETYTTRNS
jgi:hypothetical protein